MFQKKVYIQLYGEYKLTLLRSQKEAMVIDNETIP